MCAPLQPTGTSRATKALTAPTAARAVVAWPLPRRRRRSRLLRPHRRRPHHRQRLHRQRLHRRPRRPAAAPTTVSMPPMAIAMMAARAPSTPRVTKAQTCALLPPSRTLLRYTCHLSTLAPSSLLADVGSHCPPPFSHALRVCDRALLALLTLGSATTAAREGPRRRHRSRRPLRPTPSSST